MNKCMLMFSPVFMCTALTASDHSYKVFCAIKTIQQKAKEAVVHAAAKGIQATVHISGFPSALEVQTKDGLVLDISNKIEIVSPLGKIPLAVDFFGRDAQKLKNAIQSHIFSIVRVEARQRQPYPQVPTKYKVLAVDRHELPKAKNFDFSYKTDVEKNMQLWMALEKRYKKEHPAAKL